MDQVQDEFESEVQVQLPPMMNIKPNSNGELVGMLD